MHNEVQRSTVHGHVVQAHEIGELHLHGDEVSHPPLTSWQDRPDLTEELEDLLHVQRDAAETLPYRLLGVRQPELTRVYVQQSVRETERRQGDRPVPIREVLARGKHLLITGEPGAGKSTLGQMYVQRLATEWLEASADPPLPEPVMPLRIAAKALADDLPWSELLANAVRSSRLNATLKPELFAKRALGARWLVFVDGLDEIAEPERRDRVIDALVSRMRRGSGHRLVITTRPLPPDELQKLHGQDIDLFTIQPFGPVELQDFASAWFRAQNPTNSKDRAAEFVSQVHDGRLRELVRNPLLATIAAIANTLEPHRKLPHNRADLYERFMSYLLDDQASGRNTLAELRKAHADDPGRVQQIEWLYERRQDLVEQLAVSRLESEQPLLEVALLWDHSTRPEDMLAVLTSTGLFVHGDSGLRFLHHSFAEFLAARARAARIPADFPNLDEWVELGTQPANENSVLFTFALWGREPGHDLDLVIARLLEGGVKHALLAGRLLAEDVSITSGRADEVVDRLVKLLLANGVRENPWEDGLVIGRVLAGLDNEAIAHLFVPALRDMRNNDDLPDVVRIGCAVALGHLESPEHAATWMQEHADVRRSYALAAIATGLAEILPNGADLAEELLLRLMKTTDSYTLGIAVIDTLGFDIDRREPARRLLRDLVRRLKVDESVRPGSPHVPHFGALSDTTPFGWHVLCTHAVELDCPDEAMWLAERILAQSSISRYQWITAANALLTHRGELAFNAVIGRARSLTPDHVLTVAQLMMFFDRRLMRELAYSVVTRPTADNDQFVRACELLAPVPPDVLNLITDRLSLNPYDLVRLAEGPIDPASIVHRLEVARCDDERQSAGLIAAMLELGINPDDVHTQVANGLPVHRATAAAALFKAGHATQAEHLVGTLLTEPLDAMSAVICLDGMIAKKVPKEAQRLYDHLRIVVGQHDLDVARRFAPILHRVGHPEKAAEVALDAFLRSLGSHEVDDCVGTLLDLSGSTHADVVVEKVRESNLNVWQRMDIADLFINDGLLDHAVMLWLDVVRHHDLEIAKGVEAAVKLVQVGQRAQAIEAATGNRALLAWLQA
ncbi:NACHT domain-containing protein [Lentzea sp. BCCO 10_0856]|uniref:NACHT domain-containing protein n=1 Tax=Lentzea miocenica TaxID=3095431 RepID=A0ABU4T815_9PSEU|nr:NACHT domain-containing protein [Lentzea sp. BCCO 10_0856]MDX8034307.1 NACHT domain-containing protein [Lentzea sp. BCCO 10_0856]